MTDLLGAVLHTLVSYGFICILNKNHDNIMNSLNANKTLCLIVIKFRG